MMKVDVEAQLGALLERAYAVGMNPAVTTPEGRQSIGYFPVYFPEEIAHAGGVIPHALYGGGNAVEVRHADARIGSFICSICRSTTELGMNGMVKSLGGFFTQPICDAAKHMAGIWGRNFPEQNGQILEIPQNVGGSGAVRYLTDEFQRLRRRIEEMAGHPVTDDDIRESLRLYNENRRMTRELYRIKAGEPGRLSTVETYLLVRAGTRMAKEEHNDLLREALGLIAERSTIPMDKPRVIFLGGFCEQPPIAMLESIEDACTIVDDDLLIGQRWFVEDVPVDGDPVEALADSYVHRGSWSAVQHTPKPKEENLAEMIEASRADAVILTSAKFCEPGLDDQWALGKYLRARSMPQLILEFEEKMNSFEQMSMQVETFAESLLFMGN